VTKRRLDPEHSQKTGPGAQESAKRVPMSLASATELKQETPRGEVHVVDAQTREEVLADALGAGFMLAEVSNPSAALRGRLALLIEGAIEDALERIGSTPPGIGASSDLDASLSDQLYRTRLLGRSGVVVAFQSLSPLANLAGALDAEDSAVLRWWLAAAEERPVRLVFDARDRYIGVYAAPTSLQALLVQASQGASSSLATTEPEKAEPAVPEVVDNVPEAYPEAAFSSELMAFLAAELEASPPLPESEIPVLAPPDLDALSKGPSESAPAGHESAVSESDPEPSGEPEAAKTDPSHVPPAIEAAEPEPTHAPPAADAAEPEPTHAPPAADVAEPEASHAPPPAEAAEREPEPPVAAAPAEPDLKLLEACRKWIGDLELARGPKPLGTVERMFVSAYVPLSRAVAEGCDLPEARQALARWSESFARSYSEAFDALKLRGKRPTMVLDIPDLAHRIGRLHGARAVQLVLVDGMRFDLGLCVQDRLSGLLGRNAALTERLLLWAALPSTTAFQLELLGKGPAGLREPMTSGDLEVPVARGRAAATLRRVRTAGRELMKLDVIESRLLDPGPTLKRRLDDLALETAEALAGHMLRLPPRTLVLVFGDHGFVLDAQGSGTSAGRQGGATPEEVLVPAFAWLIGGVH
jgi:hypothetical protein